MPVHDSPINLRRFIVLLFSLGASRLSETPPQGRESAVRGINVALVLFEFESRVNYSGYAQRSRLVRWNAIHTFRAHFNGIGSGPGVGLGDVRSLICCAIAKVPMIGQRWHSVWSAGYGERYGFRRLSGRWSTQRQCRR